MVITAMSDQAEEAEKTKKEIWEKHYGEKNPPGDKKGKTDESAPDNKPKEEPKPDDKPKEEPKPGEKPKEEPRPEDFKHKYEVLQGKYNAEVPGLAYQLAESTKETARLKAELEEAKKPKEEPKVEQKKEENSVIKKFKEDYPEIYEGANAVANELVKEKLSRVDRIDDIEKKVGKIEEGVGDVKKDIGLSAKERYLSVMDGDPDIGKEWRKINEDSEFLAMLEETEPYSGAKKMDLLKSAWDSMDPVRTLRFFKDFKATKVPEKPKEEPKPKGDVDIHPPRGNKGEDRKPDTGEIITPEMLTKFQEDVADGKYNGKEADMKKELERLHAGLYKKRQT